MIVKWDEEGQARLRSRSTRYQGADNLEVSWTDEAAADPQAIIQDPDRHSRRERIVRITGYSSGAGCVITLVAEHRADGLWGLTAWKASGRALREYEEERDARAEG